MSKTLKKYRISIENLVADAYKHCPGGRKVRITHNGVIPKLIPSMFDRVNQEYGTNLEYYLFHVPDGYFRRDGIDDYEIDLRQITLQRANNYMTSTLKKVESILST